MRLDQYLKITRIVKKRPISKELATQERVLLNGRVAKASADVKIGDEIDIYFGHRHLKVKVLALADNIQQANKMICYEVVLEERIEQVNL